MPSLSPQNTARVEQPIATLVALATEGDESAWRALVDRLSPIIWAVCRRHRMTDVDTADVAQTVFFRLVEGLGKIREPAALPGWVQTTARRECLRLLSDQSRQRPVGEEVFFERFPDDADGVDVALLDAECLAALREAFATLPDHCQQLLRLLMADRPLPYKEISVKIGRSIGGIGPTRARCLDQLRSAPVLQPWLLALTTQGGTP